MEFIWETAGSWATITESPLFLLAEQVHSHSRYLSSVTGHCIQVIVAMVTIVPNAIAVHSYLSVFLFHSRMVGAGMKRKEGRKEMGEGSIIYTDLQVNNEGKRRCDQQCGAAVETVGAAAETAGSAGAAVA